jgi:hypothetical protein
MTQPAKPLYTISRDWITRAGLRAVIVLLETPYMKHHCGYIAVPQGHPAYGRGEDDLAVEVHGGVTFSREDSAYPVPTTQPTWWIGYDCAHSRDKSHIELGGVFRDLDYNVNECESLAKQLQAMASLEVEPVLASTSIGMVSLTQEDLTAILETFKNLAWAAGQSKLIYQPAYQSALEALHKAREADAALTKWADQTEAETLGSTPDIILYDSARNEPLNPDLE